MKILLICYFTWLNVYKSQNIPIAEDKDIQTQDIMEGKK